MRAFRLILPLLNFASFAISIRSSDSWTTVVDTSQYRNLASPCAQQCLLNIRHLKDCDSYGCVCSESDNRGTNLIAGYSEVVACVQQKCQDDSLSIRTGNAFKDVCAIAVNAISDVDDSTGLPNTEPLTVIKGLTSIVTITVNGVGSTVMTTLMETPAASEIAQPTQTCGSFVNLIRPQSYSVINACSKFVINGCRDGYGNQNEPNCVPLKTPEGWQSYAGVAHSLGCCNAYCLCAGPFFFITLSNLFNASATYCNYLPTVNDFVNHDWDGIVSVATEYCTSAGLDPDYYQYNVVGAASSVGKAQGEENGLNIADIITIVIGIAAIVISTVISVPVGFITYKTYKLVPRIKPLPSSSPSPSPWWKC